MRERLAYIDAMRGAAALLVVLQHALAQAFMQSPILQVFSPGRFGVLTFFLISGFVVPFSLRGERPLANFAVGRAARLLPALWLSIGVFLVIKGPVAPETLAANMVMLQWPLGQELITPVYWTLTFELFFYFFCAIAFSTRILSNISILGAIVIVIAFAAVLRRDERMLFCAYLVAGTVLRLAMLDEGWRKKLWAGVALVPVLAAGAAFGLARHPGNPEMVPLAICVSNTGSVLAFALLIAARPRVPRVAVWLGSISYSIYLFQDVGLLLLRPIIHASPLGYVVAVFAVTVTIAFLVWRFVELPFIELGRSLARRAAPEAI